MGLKNIEKAQVLRLGDEVEYQQGQIVSKTLAQNRALSMTLFAFEQDEDIASGQNDIVKSTILRALNGGHVDLELSKESDIKKSAAGSLCTACHVSRSMMAS